MPAVASHCATWHVGCGRWNCSWQSTSNKDRKLKNSCWFRRSTVQVRLLLTVIVLVVLAPLQAWSKEPGKNYPPTIVFMTDFGVIDDSVAICRGVMYGVM